MIGINFVQEGIHRLSDTVRSIAWTLFPFVDVMGPSRLDFEVEALLSRLIANGLIKGYLHHEKEVLVLSKVNPFPSSSASSYMT